MLQRIQNQRFRTALSAASLLLCASSAACNFTEFDSYPDNAPIRVYGTPSKYKAPGYGRELVSFQTGSDDDHSVLVASAGRDTPVVFERAWNGKKLTDDAFMRCRTKDDCKNGAGVGGTLIPFPHWALGTPQAESGCIFSPADPKAFVFCDSNTNANQSFELDVGDVAGSGFSLFFGGAGLPSEHPLGVVLFGAYAVSDRSGAAARGRVFAQPDFQPPGGPSDDDQVPPPEELPLRDPGTGELFADDAEAGDLGYAISLAEDADGNLLIAVAQPAQQRVIVASYARRGGSLVTRACLQSPDGSLDSFGKSLVVGDINKDGQPEVIVGTTPEDSAERVWLYRGVGLPDQDDSATECAEWGNKPIEVTCAEGIGDVRCEDSAFGAAVALGDIDGDGFNDLIVGAPHAQVGSASQAGAVWLFPGGADSSRDGGLDLDRATNLVADKKERALLGATVSTLHTKDRDEPAAGAPGEDRVYTFMCSALEEDVSNEHLCLPK